MTKRQIIQGIITLLKEIEWAGFNFSQTHKTCIFCGKRQVDGHWQQCRFHEALTLLEQAKEPSVGEEWTATIYSQWNDHSLHADLSWFKDNLSEACARLDAQRQKIEELEQAGPTPQEPSAATTDKRGYRSFLVWFKGTLSKTYYHLSHQQQEIERLNQLVFAYESMHAPVNPLLSENAKLKREVERIKSANRTFSNDRIEKLEAVMRVTLTEVENKGLKVIEERLRQALAEPAHVTHAKKIVNSWSRWKQEIGMPKRTTVVNVRVDKCDYRIDRSTMFGNPFVIGIHGNRDQVIAKYREYFRHRIHDDVNFLNAVCELRGSRLGCHCAPLTCHGDVIAEFLNREGEWAL